MRASALLLLLALGLWARPAAAYVCTRVLDGSGRESGPSLSWFGRNLSYTLHAAGTEDIDGEGEFDALRASFLPWETAQACAAPNNVTDLSIVEADALSTVDRVGYDFLDPEANENLLIFRDDAWPHVGQSNIIALTTTTYVPLTGQIFDADIEFNSADFEFATTGSESRMDLMNTAVHEIGHFLGLGHEEDVPGATMEPTGSPGEVHKRDLHCDDRNAIVFKYGSDESNGYCSSGAACGFCSPPEELERSASVENTGEDDGLDDGCGCRGGGPEALWIVLLGVGAAWRRRRGLRRVG